MNCKPNELAIVIRGLNQGSQHTGKIVRVLDLAFPMTKLGPVWTVEFERPLNVFTYKKNLELIGVKGLSNRCHCPDAWLRPIRPDAADLETETKAVISTPRVLEPA